MRLAPLCSVVLGLALLGLGDAHAQSPLRWKLDLQPDQARTHAAGRRTIPSGKLGNQTYWYVVYTVTNTHEEPVTLHLNATVETDASDESFNEGYYPKAVKWVQEKFGDDVKDAISLRGQTLEPGESVRAVSVFQIFEPNAPNVSGKAKRRFEERVDALVVKFSGYADPVKTEGQEFAAEHLQLWMHFAKIGDQHAPNKESVMYLGQEERVVE